MKEPAYLATLQRIRAAVPRPLVCILLLAAAGACAPPAPVRAAPSSPAETRGVVDLLLLGTTDVHGRLYAHDYYTGRATDHGLALLKPVIDSVRAANPGRVYLFDSGDLLQGNPLGYVYARGERERPNAIVKAMNLLGYDAAAIGNHEFNYGIPHLDRAVEQAKFPFVSANIYHHERAEHAYAPYTLLPHVVAEGDTILIGVTGNTPPGVHVWDRANVEGKLDFREIVSSVAAVVGEMRERGADLVVVLSHGGFEGTSYDTVATGLPPENAAARLAREVPGIDVIFLGHTHQELADSTIVSAANPRGVLLTQARNWARSLAVAELRLQRRGAGEWTVASKGASLLRPNPARADTALLDSLRWEHERTIAYVRSVAGRSAVRWEAREARVRDTPILDFINEVQRRAAGADISATAAFNLAAALPEGEITVADLAGLYVYDNTLKAVRVTGAQLKAFLEKSAEYYDGWPAPAGGSVTNFRVPGYNFDVVSGVEYTIDLSRPLGERIVDLRFRGRPVRPDQTFTMALNNYRQGGGGGFSMVAGAPVVYDRQEDIRELLIEEVRRRGTIRPEDYFQENWRIVPAPAAEAALREQARREAPAAAAPGPAARARLRVLATNDFHGNLLPQRPSWAGGREVGGAATLAAYFAHERAGFEGPTLVLDGGDVMQGTSVSNLTQGRATVDYYNTAGYRAAALGNHEFDWGVPVLRERLAQASFPWLAANLFVAGADTAPAWVKPVALLEVGGGRKVGIIGLSTAETPEATRPSHVAGLEFRSGAEAIDRWVPALRREGADFVIVVAHSGAVCDADGRSACRGEIVEWAKAVRHRPDLIVAGHTHQMVQTRVNGIPVVEAASQGARYAVVDLERLGPDSVHAWIRGLPVAYADRVRPDSAVAGLVARFREEVGPRLREVVATLAEPLGRGAVVGAPGSSLERMGEYPLGRLIADAQRAATGAGVAITNNGGIRINLDAGPLTWGTLSELHPFGNVLIRLRLTGAQLREALEVAVAGERPRAHVSGLTLRYDPARPAGSRILAVELESGEPLQDGRSYTVTVNDFMAEGGDGFAVLRQASSRENTGVTDLDALVDYMRRLPQPVTAPREARLRPVAEAARSR